jgi:hypothetical protein
MPEPADRMRAISEEEAAPAFVTLAAVDREPRHVLLSALDVSTCAVKFAKSRATAVRLVERRLAEELLLRPERRSLETRRA